MHELSELKKLWNRMLGAPPADEQFEVWMALHTPEVIRQAILRTAGKNLSLAKTMTADFQIRFASKVMLVQTERNAANAANRARLDAHFGNHSAPLQIHQERGQGA